MEHTKNISDQALAAIRKMQQSELTESVIYEEIAQFAKGIENKETLLRSFTTFFLFSIIKTFNYIRNIIRFNR